MAQFWGAQLQVPKGDESRDSILILEPILGLDLGHPSINEPQGATPKAENFIIRDGALEPRPMLIAKTTNQQPVTFVTGGYEGIDVLGVRTPIASGLTQPFRYVTGAWSRISYVPANGINTPPSTSAGEYWDMAQMYHAATDENVVLMTTAGSSYQTIYVHQLNTTVFSTLTGAPKAKYIAPFNDYLVAFNIQDPGSAGSHYVQRVQWNDRGSLSSWTGGLSGFNDLLDMRGAGTRIIPQENRLLVFSEDEIWQGLPVAFPFIFDFQPLDRTVGCPYPWTIANTPIGAMFLSKDYNIYLVSKWGGPARAMGPQVQKYLRDNADKINRSWAVYDRTYNQYQLYFPRQGGSGYPQAALYLNVGSVDYSPIYTQIGKGAWALQTFDPIGGRLSLTRGFEAQGSSAATTWAQLLAAGVQWGALTQTWGQLNGVSENRQVIVGSSGGTLYGLDSARTDDAGISVPCFWQSAAMFGYQPNKQKTMDRIRIDYLADQDSNISLAASRNQGATFDQDFKVTLPSNSAMSEGVAHFYAAARYPMFRLTSEGFRYKLFRFWLRVTTGGR